MLLIVKFVVDCSMVLLAAGLANFAAAEAARSEQANFLVQPDSI